MPVGAGEHAGGNARGVIIAGLRGHFLGDQPAAGLEVQHEHLRFQQAGGHPAAHARHFPVEQRHHRAHRQQIAGRQIRDGNAHPHRPLARQPGDGHQPAHPLRNLVHPRARPIRPILTEATDGRIHNARVDLLHVVERNLEAMLHRRAHILDNHVRRGHQPHERRMTFGVLQVQIDGALVSMQVLEIEAVPCPGNLLRPRLGRRLNADHVRPPIRQMAHAGRASARQGQVEDRNARKRQLRV